MPLLKAQLVSLIHRRAKKGKSGIGIYMIKRNNFWITFVSIENNIKGCDVITFKNCNFN